MNYYIKVSKKWDEQNFSGQVEFDNGEIVKVVRNPRRLRDAVKEVRRLAAADRRLAA